MKWLRNWQAMRAAASGVYCGPLRLLAMEVYDELNALGTRCDLITGARHLWSVIIFTGAASLCYWACSAHVVP